MRIDIFELVNTFSNKQENSSMVCRPRAKNIENLKKQHGSTRNTSSFRKQISSRVYIPCHVTGTFSIRRGLSVKMNSHAYRRRCLMRNLLVFDRYSLLHRGLHRYIISSLIRVLDYGVSFKLAFSEIVDHE